MKAAQDLEQLSKFAVLLADPPWRFDDAEPTRSVENHYQTLPLADICAWEVPAADDATLFVWVPASLLPTGLAVTKAWGFQYKTHFVWVKDTKGMGNYSRLQHELLFVATRGGLPPPLPANRSGSVFQAPRGAHSVKPTVAYEVIERAYPALPKVELFARSRRPGWTPLGDQVPDPT